MPLLSFTAAAAAGRRGRNRAWRGMPSLQQHLLTLVYTYSAAVATQPAVKACNLACRTRDVIAAGRRAACRLLGR